MVTMCKEKIEDIGQDSLIPEFSGSEFLHSYQIDVLNSTDSYLGMPLLESREVPKGFRSTNMGNRTRFSVASTLQPTKYDTYSYCGDHLTEWEKSINCGQFWYRPVRLFKPTYSYDGEDIVDLEYVETKEVPFKRNGTCSGYYNGKLVSPPIFLAWKKPAGYRVMPNKNNRYPNGLRFVYSIGVDSLLNPLNTISIITNINAKLDVNAEIQKSLEG